MPAEDSQYENVVVLLKGQIGMCSLLLRMIVRIFIRPEKGFGTSHPNEKRTNEGNRI